MRLFDSTSVILWCECRDWELGVSKSFINCKTMAVNLIMKDTYEKVLWLFMGDLGAETSDDVAWQTTLKMVRSSFESIAPIR